MRTILSFMVAFTAIALLGTVYAERSTVEVPFDYHGHGCTFDQDKVIYTCHWEGSSETVTKQGLNDAGIIPPEQIIKESKEAHEEAETEKEKASRTPQEAFLDSLQVKSDKGTISSADAELLRLLKEMEDSCQLGIEHGALIQGYAEFELPTVDPRTDYKAIDYSKNIQLGNIIKKIEECQAWDDYRVTHLGQRYLDIEVDDSTSQGYHADVTEQKPQPTHSLTSDDIENAEKQANNSICRASFYDAQFKKQAGCENTPAEKYPAIVNKGLDLNPAYKAYKQYMSTGHVDTQSLKKEQVSKYRQESLESFAQLHGIDIADLKNLVQGDKP